MSHLRSSELGLRGLLTARRLAVLLAGSAALGGCHPQQLVVPSDVGALEVLLPAEHRKDCSGLFCNESFGIGAYRVTDVDRDWTSSSESFFSSEKRTRAGFSFALQSQGASLEGRCRATRREQDTKVWVLTLHEESESLSCRCGQAATLELTVDERGAYRGGLSASGEAYEVESLHEGERAHSDNPLGYRIGLEPTVAAVDVVHPGRVWLSAELPKAEEEAVICLAAGLLLYERPPEDR